MISARIPPKTDQNCRLCGWKAPRLLTIREFCAAVRISERHYHRMKAAGVGPRVIPIGGKVMHSEYEPQRWLRELEVRYGKTA